jgi:maltose-binding protein MalE
MSVENIGWVQNTAIMGTTCPKTLDAALSKINAYNVKASAAKKLKQIIAVPGGDQYHHYPLISGLGGYNFGTKLNGSLDKNKVGLDNDLFMKNVAKFAVWQKSKIFGNYDGQGFGLTTNYGKGLAAATFTGPWSTNDIVALSKRASNPIKSIVCPFPTFVSGIVVRPFSGVQGLMMTKWAGQSGHASVSAAQAFINYAGSVANQNTYAKYAGVIPANKGAKASGLTTAHNVLLAGFKAAGTVATPMPNLPEAGAMWGAMGTALSKSLAKINPTKPATAWRQAAENLRDAVNG